MLLPVRHQPAKAKTEAAPRPSQVQKRMAYYLVATPDTSKTHRTTEPAPQQIREADNFTKVIRILGIAFLAVGAMMLIVGLASTGWVSVIYFAYGLVILAFSVPFLIFRSKNSTRSFLVKKQRAARQTSK